MSLYFDAMASTVIKPEVTKVMLEVYNSNYGNPSSNHVFARALSAKIAQAKALVLAAVHAPDYELIWTSGATESINLALQGAAKSYARQGKHLITFTTEHKATLATFKHLADIGFETSILEVGKSGQINQSELLAAIRADTILVSICHVNNEIGYIQDLKALVSAVQAKGCLVHIDAAQSIGKVELNLQQIPADFISLSAHKFSGPQGIGALLVRQTPKRQLQALSFGGDQQYVRPGTMPAALIVGMGVAISLAKPNASIVSYQQQIMNMLKTLGGVTLHGCATKRVAHNINIHIDGVNAQSLKYLLSEIALASGSACNASSPEPSHVLLALGYSRVDAGNSLRISLGEHLTESMVHDFCKRFTDAVVHLRTIAGYSND